MEMEMEMEKCEVCKNESGNFFKIMKSDKIHVFDSFECAIHAVAPRCHHCQCRIIGHGVEGDNTIYCCLHCVRQAEKVNFRDQELPLLFA